MDMFKGLAGLAINFSQLTNARFRITHSIIGIKKNACNANHDCVADNHDYVMYMGHAFFMPVKNDYRPFGLYFISRIVIFFFNMMGVLGN